MAFIRRAFDTLENQKKKRTSEDIAVFFLLVAIAVLFMPFMILLIVNTSHGFAVPNAFALSTLMVLFSSWTIRRARLYKTADAYRSYRRALTAILVAGLLFLCFQYAGWHAILSAAKTQHINIIRVLVLVHAIHFLVAIALVLAMMAKTYRIKTSSDFYIYFLNFKKELFFTLSIRYWEFLSFLWVFMYILMLVR